jgi:hypothetical protein
VYSDSHTRWFKYDRDYLCVNKSQFVPVIFEPPCICHNSDAFRQLGLLNLPDCVTVMMPKRAGVMTCESECINKCTKFCLLYTCRFVTVIVAVLLYCCKHLITPLCTLYVRYIQSVACSLEVFAPTPPTEVFVSTTLLLLSTDVCHLSSLVITVQVHVSSHVTFHIVLSAFRSAVYKRQSSP